MKKVKSLKDFGSSRKSVIETIENEAREQKSGIPRMLLGALNISLLGHLLSRKGVKVKRVGCTLIRAGDGVN